MFKIIHDIFLMKIHMYVNKIKDVLENECLEENI